MKAILSYILPLAVIFAGCATPPKISDIVIGPDYEVTNFNRRDPAFPPDIKTVAILPISGNVQNTLTSEGKEYLEQVVKSEFDKVGRFEGFYVTREQMKKWSGKETWRADEVIPKSILEKIALEAGAQGILFVHLSNYNPYPPLMIGWKMKLVRLDSMEVLWALDEVFDAGQENVSNSARRYSKNRVPTNPVLADSRTVLLSPTIFARYSLTASLATMPVR
jgi:hypothetical protein